MSQPKYTPLDEHENEGNLFSTNVSDFDSPMKHGHHHSFFKTKTFKILLVVAAILTLVLVAAVVFILTKSNSSHNHKFNLSPSWNAAFTTQKVEVRPGTWVNISGNIWMDAAINNRFRIDIMDNMISLIFTAPYMYLIQKVPSCKYNETIYPINDFSMFKLNFTYENLVSQYTDDNGKKATCDLFTSQPLGSGSLTVCLANDEILAYTRFNIPKMGDQNATQAFIYFKNFQTWNTTQDNHNSIFEVPAGCELVSNSTYHPTGGNNKRSFEDDYSFVKPILSYLNL